MELPLYRGFLWAQARSTGEVLNTIAQDASRQAQSRRPALAWLLRRSPVMLPIPGTSSVEHLEENVAAASVHLTDEEYDRLAEAPELVAPGESVE